MEITVREMKQDDVEAAAAIFFESFNSFNASVGLAPEWPNLEFCRNVILGFIEHPGYKAFVALDGKGRVIGSNFLEFHDSVAAPGPISVEAGEQNRGAGRLLMLASIDCAWALGKTSIRGVQVT
ncbi:hypothetical protein GTY86_33090, partial [Streptomyces sp. SID5770]|nr:hypothetical protein [Streptomyces sp. SID5770]